MLSEDFPTLESLLVCLGKDLISVDKGVLFDKSVYNRKVLRGAMASPDDFKVSARILDLVNTPHNSAQSKVRNSRNADPNVFASAYCNISHTIPSAPLPRRIAGA